MRFLRSGLIEVLGIGTQDTMQLLLVKDEQVIEALTPHTAQKPLTDGIGSRGVIRRLEHLDATGLGNSIEGRPKLAIMITDEVLRPHTKGGGFSQLLRRPSIGWRSCDAHVDHLPGVQFDDEEGKQRTEEEVSHWQKVARPDLLGMGL